MLNRPRVLLESMQQLLGWLSEGKLRVEVSHRVPLERAPEAFKAMLERKVIGKALLLVTNPVGDLQRSRL